MKIRIQGDISGSRDGVPWPKRGETMELPDDEGASLCASGLAVPVKSTDGDVEKAVPADESEERASGLTKETAEALTGDAAQKQEHAQPAKKTAAKRTAAKPAEGK